MKDMYVNYSATSKEEADFEGIMYKEYCIMESKKLLIEKLTGGRLIFAGLFSFLFFLFSFSARSQEVTASVDTTTIKIGEQITYRISVETSAGDLVVFPEGQTFSPLEMIESFAVDTARTQDRLRLLKEYALTQFDSGSYTIPRQRVQIEEETFFTDSIRVEVRDVVVDTTKQKMYPIKPSVPVPPDFSVPGWVWWLVGALLLLGIIYFFFRRKKKKEAEAKRLPPYEQAIFELKKLDDSHLLEQREIKEYYSQLSSAVRRYLDEEVYDHALESTTSELILYLEAQRDSGNLRLENTTIERLKRILERADLAKFANTKPDVITAKEDRTQVEGVINETKASIPEPTEEELLQDKLYREKRERKRKVVKIVIGVFIACFLLAGVATYLVATQGLAYVKDTYLGHPTKELLEGEWIRSEYGTPAVAITTPKVLKRGEVEMPAEARAALSGSETFLYGSLLGNFYVSLTTVQFNQQTQFDLEAAVEGVYAYLEQQGARNILMKQEKFTTVNGAEGIKIFGTLDIENPVNNRLETNEYAILNFAENNGFQQITIIHNEDDIYADEITQRILNSVELQNVGN